jgi:hypothetical protein
MRLPWRFCAKIFEEMKIWLHLHLKNNGAIAQLVEQRTENPCVRGSIPRGTTPKNESRNLSGFLNLQ